MNIEMPHQARRELLEVGNAVYAKVQPELAMCHYHDQNKTATVDIAHPMRNTKEVRDMAMGLWNDSFSGLFDDYVRDNIGLDVDLSDPKDVADLYSDFMQWNKQRPVRAADIEGRGYMD